MKPVVLPPSLHVFERGWLSSNNVLFVGGAPTLIDSGYATHAEQTLALVRNVLGQRKLAHIVNSHLHSDHCGGNALLQRHYGCAITIPAAEADAVRHWDEDRLSYRATGQHCDRFTFNDVLSPGDTVTLGDLDWMVLGAPGHDPNALLFYSADERILISADALWQNGFGVIFPELDGGSGFAEQDAVLDLIAQLDVRLVIPGHGAPFTDVAQALHAAHGRLDYLRADPQRNAKNALKVLIVFKLMAVQRLDRAELYDMLDTAHALRSAAAMLAPPSGWRPLLDRIAQELVSAGAARANGDALVLPS